MTRPDRAELAAQAAVDRDAAHIDRIHAAARRRAQNEARRVLTPPHYEYYPRALRRHGWELLDYSGAKPVVLASGRTFTETGRDNAWYAAYLKALREPGR